MVNDKPAPGIAAHGHDVVAYFTTGKPTAGDAKFAVVHGDATYRFSTQANLDAFKASPAKYVRVPVTFSSDGPETPKNGPRQPPHQEQPTRR